MHLNWYKISNIKWKDTAQERLLDIWAPELVPIWREKNDRFNFLIEKYFEDLKDPSIGNSVELPEEAKKLDKEITEILRIPKEKEDARHQEALEEHKKQKEETERRFENAHKLGPKLEKLVRKRFPVTDNPRLAGFMMKNGDMLMFSYTGHDRDVDHRYVREAFPEEYAIDDGTDGMIQFMKATGAIRMNIGRSSNYAAFDSMSSVSYQQKEKLIDIIQSLRIKEGVFNLNNKAIQFDGENYYKVIGRL